MGASELSAVQPHQAGNRRRLSCWCCIARVAQPLAGVQAQATYQRYDQPSSAKKRARLGDVLQTAATGEVELPAPNQVRMTRWR